MECLRSVLRIDVSRYVRDTADRLERGDLTTAYLVEDICILRLRDDAAVRSVIDSSDHSGREPIDVRSEDRRADRNYEHPRRCDLCGSRETASDRERKLILLGAASRLWVLEDRLFSS